MAAAADALTCALSFQGEGRFAEAEEICLKILAANPEFAPAWHVAGAVSLQCGRWDEAYERIQRAIEIDPQSAAALINLAIVFRAKGHVAEAEVAYRRALQIDPESFLAWLNLGILLKDRGQLVDAEQSVRRAAELNGASAVAQFALGAIAKASGNEHAAVACYEKAIELAPDYVEAIANLGSLRLAQGSGDEAASHYGRAIRLRPNMAALHNNLGNAMRQQGRSNEAAAAYREAISLDPAFAEAHANLGGIFRSWGQLDSALACYRRAVELNPGLTSAHSSLIYLLHFSSDYDAAALYAAHLDWQQKHAAPWVAQVAAHKYNRSPTRQLRIGYLSPDFRDHCQSLFTLPLLSRHDRSQFQVYCYASVARPDQVTRELQSRADVWRDIQHLDDDAAAAQIREDQIDILIDLCMHMSGGRPLIFARKPAPIQACWLAYPSTTGLTAMDYRLTDPYLDPPPIRDRCYSERSIQLPRTFWCFDPLTDEPPVTPLPAVTRGYITFGCLNDFLKVNTATVALWASVLCSIDDSRLIMLAPEQADRRTILELFGSAGVRPDRIEFVAPAPRRQYLAVYQGVDIALDTLLYNGHTTTLDALWMGVPVVTLPGETAVGRGGVSLLSNVGLSHLVASSRDDFVRITKILATDLQRLGELRQSLRSRLSASPLMDSGAFTRSLEAAYKTMWKEWCRGKTQA